MVDYLVNNEEVGSEEVELRDLRRLSLLFLMSAVSFFPMILNPLIIGFYDAETDAARVEHVEDNLNALRALFTGIGLTELALGMALWLWGRHVAARSSGRRGAIASTFSRVGLAVGVTAIIGRLLPLFDDVETFASGDISSIGMIVAVVTFVGFSLSFLVFGALMIMGEMPTWLGVVWIACGVLFWAGFLPLWFFVGALAFGIRGLLRFRPGAGREVRISANRAV